MNIMLVQNSVSTAGHENFHSRDFSILNTENSRSIELHFRNENTGTEHRQLSEFLRFQRIPYYHYEHKDTNSRLVFGFNNHMLLGEMLSEIDSLLKNEYDWDEIGYSPPTFEDISRAKSVLRDFVFTISYEGYSLKKPYISNSEDGGAKIEWHLDKRSLYLRINRLESNATKIQDEPDGTTTVDTKPFLQQDYLSLWKWLINE